MTYTSDQELFGSAMTSFFLLLSGWRMEQLEPAGATGLSKRTRQRCQERNRVFFHPNIFLQNHFLLILYKFQVPQYKQLIK